MITGGRRKHETLLQIRTRQYISCGSTVAFNSKVAEKQGTEEKANREIIKQ